MNLKKNENFADLLEESFSKRKSAEPGAEYEAIVRSVREDYTLIQTNQDKIQGILPTKSWQQAGLKVKQGDIIKVYFLRENFGDFIFTTCLTDDELTIENLYLAMRNNIPALGTVAGQGNGGIEIRLNDIHAFCPFSQADQDQKTSLTHGSQVKVLVTEIQRGRTQRIIVSQRKFADMERELKKEFLKSELKEGSFVTFKIKSIHNFGLIGDIGGADALVPASEASFQKNLDLRTTFQPGQVLRAKVLTLNWKENKISLTLKEFLEDPWSKKISFQEGELIEGKIDSIKPFGIFIKLTPEFSCLVPSKETGLPPRTPLQGHFKQGDPVEVLITEINPEKRQIAGSIAKASEARDRVAYQGYLSKDENPSSRSSFGAILEKSLKNRKS